MRSLVLLLCIAGAIACRGKSDHYTGFVEGEERVLRSEVTNQPAGVSNPKSSDPAESRGDIGLRAIVQPGYEIARGFVLAVRLSYQGRTIYHAGPGFGGAVSYSW